MMNIFPLSPKAKIDKAIAKTTRLIELTERKLELLKTLHETLKTAKAHGVHPDNLKGRQLELFI